MWQRCSLDDCTVAWETEWSDGFGLLWENAGERCVLLKERDFVTFPGEKRPRGHFSCSNPAVLGCPMATTLLGRPNGQTVSVS